MIKVLDKTFSVLEALASCTPGSMKPGPLAKQVAINSSTCSRILKDLCDSGYVERVSREAGYRIGARTRALSQSVVKGTPLLSAADRLVEECAQRIKASLILAQRQGLQRYIVLHHDYHQRTPLSFNTLGYEDFFSTATGALLLAFAGREVQDAALRKFGMPAGGLFGQVADSTDYYRILDGFKKQGWIRSDVADDLSTIYAVPVFQDGICLAALGAIFLDGLASDAAGAAMLEDVTKTARHISLSISSTRSLG
jgi:DNA-binding IclR family transcriptional regulator